MTEESEHDNFPEEVKALIDGATVLRDTNIAHEELGPEDSFEQADELKNQFCVFVLSVLKDIGIFYEGLNAPMRERSLKDIEQHLGNMTRIATAINEYLSNKSNKRTSEFDQERVNFIRDIRDVYIALESSLYTFMLEIKTLKLEGLTGDSVKFIIDDKLKEAEKVVKKMNLLAEQAFEKAKTIEQSAAVIQDEAIHKGIEKAESYFVDAVNHHKEAEHIWLGLFILFSVATICTTWYVIFVWETPDFTAKSVYFELIQRILFITLPAIFMKLTHTVCAISNLNRFFALSSSPTMPASNSGY